MNLTNAEVNCPGITPILRRLAGGLGGVLSVCCFVLTPAEAEVRVVGSDVLGSTFTQELLELGARANVELRVTLDGSLPAQGQLLAGNADVGLLVAGPDAAPLPASFQALPWAYFAVAVVVPAGNPVTELSVPQLAAIFGSLESTSAQRWGELGLDDALWRNRSLGVHAPAPAAGLAHDLFRHVVLGNRSFRENITLHATSGELIQTVAAAPNAIGFVPLGSADAVGIRVLPLRVQAMGSPHPPDSVALHRGSYLLRLPLRLVFRRSAAAQLEPLLKVLLAEEGSALVRAAGWTPLSTEVRREVARELARLAEPQNNESAK